MSAALISLMNTWTALWSQRMAQSCWQGGLFVLAVWLFCRLFARLHPALRCGLWWLAGAKLLVSAVGLPPLSLAVLPPHTPPGFVAGMRETAETRDAPVPSRPLLSSSGAPRSSTAQVPIFNETAFARSERAGTGMERKARLAAGRPDWRVVLCGVWLVGLACRLGLLAYQFYLVRRLLRQASPIRDADSNRIAQEMASCTGLKRVPCLLLSANIDSPLVIGILRPAVLLPEGAMFQLSSEELRLVLAHEFAHIRRADAVLGLLPALVSHLFYFYPLAWLAYHEFVCAREEACDVGALLGTQASPELYGQLILRFIAGDRKARVGLAMGTRYHALHRRLSMLQTPVSLPRHRAQSYIAVLTIGALACLLPWRVVAKSSPLRLAKQSVPLLNSGSKSEALTTRSVRTTSRPHVAESPGLEAAPERSEALAAKSGSSARQEIAPQKSQQALITSLLRERIMKAHAELAVANARLAERMSLYQVGKAAKQNVEEAKARLAVVRMQLNDLQSHLEQTPQTPPNVSMQQKAEAAGRQFMMAREKALTDALEATLEREKATAESELKVVKERYQAGITTKAEQDLARLRLDHILLDIQSARQKGTAIIIDPMPQAGGVQLLSKLIRTGFERRLEHLNLDLKAMEVTLNSLREQYNAGVISAQDVEETAQKKERLLREKIVLEQQLQTQF